MSAARLKNFINGEWVDGDAAQVYPVTNPATGEPLAEVPLGGVDGRRPRRASRSPGLCAAGAACPGRRARALPLRAQAPAREARRGARRRSSRASTARRSPSRAAACGAGIEMRRGGHRRAVAADGPGARGHRHAASTASRSASRSASSPASRRSTSRPWCRCGSSRSRSPAGTPSSASRRSRCRSRQQLIFELIDEAGFPPGVLNLVQRRQGRGRTRSSTTRDIAGVSFVGSSPVAEHVYKTAAAKRQARAGAGRRQELHRS